METGSVAAVLVMLTVSSSVLGAAAAAFCPTALWNFGDSLTDAGGSSNLFPLSIDAERSPYGETFFGQPSKRFTNGRVVPDFFALAFRQPLLQPYVQVGAFDYRYGANFASGGTTASNDTSRNPVVFLNQVAQFNRLRLTTIAQKKQSPCSPFVKFLPKDGSYSGGLFTTTIGGNDVLNALLLRGLPIENITSVVIPEAMINIAQGIQNLYESGARNFLFFNAPNAGCATIIITLLGSTLELDPQGCVALVNQLDQAFNSALNKTFVDLRPEYPDATISIFDYYAANEEILLNPTTYGFDANLTKTACCGAPGVGPLNYNPAVPCGATGSSKCADPEKYVNWDGVHFTDAFYRVISKFALSGEFTDTGVNYTATCNLRLKDFEPSATFDRVYGKTCGTTFLS